MPFWRSTAPQSKWPTLKDASLSSTELLPNTWAIRREGTWDSGTEMPSTVSMRPARETNSLMVVCNSNDHKSSSIYGVRLLWRTASSLALRSRRPSNWSVLLCVRLSMPNDTTSANGETTSRGDKLKTISCTVLCSEDVSVRLDARMSSGFLIARGTPFLSDMRRSRILWLKLGSNKEFS